MVNADSSSPGDDGHAPITAAVLYEKDEYLEPLRGAIVAADGVVAAEIRFSELTAGLLEKLGARVLLVNLEPVLDRRPELLDLVLHEQGNSRLILNDAAASAGLRGSDRARWTRHLAAKLSGEQDSLPPAPRNLEEGRSDFEVWVLGASIGGPEAVRSFLARLEGSCPAALLLAQHIGAEFVDAMVIQLQGVSALPVELATDGSVIRPGVVTVVPVDSKLIIEHEGSIRLAPFAQPPTYAPCIDDVLREVTGHFGPRAHALIFSGMASDGIAGAKSVLDSGGELWVQDPETCVVASMVEGAISTGQVRQNASPEHLAELFNQRANQKENLHGPACG